MPVVAGTLTLLASATIAGAQTNPQGTAATVSLALPTAEAFGSGSETISFGTGSGQCDIYCAGDFTLNAGASVTWDLFTGTDFKDVFGQTAAFRKLKALFVGITSGGDTAGVTVGNAASDVLELWFGAATSTWTIYPSGAPMIGGQPAGLTVDATNKNVKILNNGAVAVTVRVILAGSSV
jgi:hypothetical protein